MSTTLSAQSKNTVTLRGQYKAGSGWEYNDPNLTYDGATDPVSGNAVYYNSIGLTTTLTAQSKNSVTVTPQTKS